MMQLQLVASMGLNGSFGRGLRADRRSRLIPIFKRKSRKITYILTSMNAKSLDTMYYNSTHYLSNAI